MSDMTLIAEGKTKRIWRSDEWADNEQRLVAIESKDDITAGDGATREAIDGKAALATQTTINCFELLERNGIRTHFDERLSPTMFRALEMRMIPLELVVRRVATGSYLKRYPDIAEGTIFDDLVLEVFEKDDANHDPLLIIDLFGDRLLRFSPSKPLSVGLISEERLDDTFLAGVTNEDILELAAVTRQVFRVLEEAWEKLGVTLVDLKIECGYDFYGNLAVADVIDNDSWRIWKGGRREGDVSKQRFRDLFSGSTDPKSVAAGLGEIKKNYAEVAAMTFFFAS